MYIHYTHYSDDFNGANRKLSLSPCLSPSLSIRKTLTWYYVMPVFDSSVFVSRIFCVEEVECIFIMFTNSDFYIVADKILDL